MPLKKTNLYGFDYLENFKQKQDNKSLQMIIAAGPFTTENNLSYEPLKDLLKIVVQEEPHILYLQGPFIDKNNTDIKEGEVYFYPTGSKEPVYTSFE